MKILELRFKNLNSLYGEWFIDFTAPEYISNGIFALTGPTGAGKTTILDAICLALYGATPRLGKITKNSNEIISRQTGDCYAEVVFESQAGRFRCHFAQHRARKKAAGDLQSPHHEIAEAKGGEDRVIESQIRRVATVVEEKTGMDFERFTRSILLAQGGFDTFLKADAEQKSRILEQITGSEIYSEISRKVHERWRDEREKLNILQAETAGIIILEPEQEREIEQNLQEKREEEAKLDVKVTKISKTIKWLHDIDEIKKEINVLTEEARKLQPEMELFKPERERLSLALKAAELDGEYATLTAVRKEQTTDQATLKKEENKLPELKESTKLKLKALKAAEEQTLKTKNDLKHATPLIRQVRSLEQKLTAQKMAVASGSKSCKKDNDKINTDKQLRQKELAKQIKARENLGLINQYLKDHSQDERLISELAGIKEQLNGLSFRQEEITYKTADEKRAKTVLKQAVEKLRSYQEQYKKHEQELNIAVGELKSEEKSLNDLLDGRLLREYRTEKDTLLRELTFLTKIAELKDHRAKLEDGKPCPLCGAEEHPFAQGNIPVPDKTENKIEAFIKLIQKAENLEATIKKLETAVDVIRKNLAKSESLKTIAANQKTIAEKNLSDLINNLKQLGDSFKEAKRSVLINLKPFGIEEIPESDLSFLLKSLEDRLKSWEVQVKKKTEMTTHISELDSELKRLAAIIETQANVLAEKQRYLDSIRKEYADGKIERQKLFGDKNADEEELRLNKAISDAEWAEKQARDSHNATEQKLNSTETNLISLKQRIEERIFELKKLESNFKASLQPAGFIAEKQFLEAILTTEERNRLAVKSKQLDDWQTDIKARQKDRQNRLAIEIDAKLTNKGLEELEPQLKELEELLKQIRANIASLKHTLAENMTAKKRIKDKLIAIKIQKKECLQWEKLYTLIGSADGKKYRNFAQGLTFELMVSHANLQLQKMTDRYLLIRDNEKPLELNVIDNYQAGEIRSSRNLSGGESFIVSLTLALGLSKMASRKVRVDSLFLDEGFGTLDEESLETALETLSSLQQEGKLIGIVSHISALKERISTQIMIAQISGGKSTLNGPGCSKLSD